MALLVKKNIVPHFQNNSLDTVIKEMVEYLDIDETNAANVDKLTRYLECFAEFLLSESKKDVQQHIADASKELEDSDDPYLKQLANIKM